jgi:hypothetical protein
MASADRASWIGQKPCWISEIHGRLPYAPFGTLRAPTRADRTRRAQPANGNAFCEVRVKCEERGGGAGIRIES